MERLKKENSLHLEHQQVALDSITISDYAWTDDKDHQFFVRLRDLIKGRGQLCPIHVRQLKNDKYAIIDGHRIYQALHELNINPVWIFNHGEMDEDDALLLALELNLTRARHDAVHLSKAISRTVKTFGMIEFLKRVNIDPHDAESYVFLATHDWRAWCKQAAKDSTPDNLQMFAEPVENKEVTESVVDNGENAEAAASDDALDLFSKAASARASTLVEQPKKQPAKKEEKGFAAQAEEQEERTQKVEQESTISNAQWSKVLNVGFASGKNFDQIDEIIKKKFGGRVRDLKTSQFEAALEALRA